MEKPNQEITLTESIMESLAEDGVAIAENERGDIVRLEVEEEEESQWNYEPAEGGNML